MQADGYSPIYLLVMAVDVIMVDGPDQCAGGPGLSIMRMVTTDGDGEEGDAVMLILILMLLLLLLLLMMMTMMTMTVEGDGKEKRTSPDKFSHGPHRKFSGQRD
jgi:hypothetical protein